MTFSKYQEYVETYEFREPSWWEYVEYNMRYGTIPLKITLEKVPRFHMWVLWWKWLLQSSLRRVNGVYSRYSEGKIFSNGECLRIANQHQWDVALQMAHAGVSLSEIKSFLEL